MQDASLPTLRQLASLLMLTLALSLTLRAEGERRYLGQVGMVEVRVTRPGQEGETMPLPRLHLGREEQVVVSLDLLGEEAPELAYRLRHCNADGSPSKLQAIEYVSGFEWGDLEPPTASLGTRIPYQHYTLSLPNAHTQLKASGYYILEIMPASDPDSILVSTPLLVSEETARLSASWAPLALRGEAETHQQMEVSASQLPLGTRAEAELTLVVVQNGTLSHIYRNPSSSLGDKAYYNGLDGISLEGGNEYRRIEYTGEYDMGQGVEGSAIRGGLIELQAPPSEPRAHLPYQYERDHNGRSLVASQRGRAPETEADYALVTFVLSMPYKAGGRVVLSGSATRYLSQEQKTMHYDSARAGYVCTLPLKMGYHEWLYLWQSDSPELQAPYAIEGSHRETSNDYTLLLYRRSPSDLADRLIATLEVAR